MISAYVGSGLQLFVGGTVIVWMPSYFNRYYGLDTDKAGLMAAIIVLCSGAGMILCGMLSDRLCRNRPDRKISLAIAYCLGSCALLSLAFALPAGLPQLLLIGLGMFIATGTSGPAGAMVANLTHASVHGTAFATLTLANNLLGLAPGPSSPARCQTTSAWTTPSSWCPSSVSRRRWSSSTASATTTRTWPGSKVTPAWSPPAPRAAR